MGMSFPATDSKVIYYFLVFVSNSYWSENKNQGLKGSSPDSFLNSSVKTLKRTSCGQENMYSKPVNLYKIQNIAIETYFMLTLKIKFARLEILFTCKHNNNS